MRHFVDARMSHRCGGREVDVRLPGEGGGAALPVAVTGAAVAVPVPAVVPVPLLGRGSFDLGDPGLQIGGVDRAGGAVVVAHELVGDLVLLAVIPGTGHEPDPQRPRVHAGRRGGCPPGRRRSPRPGERSAGATHLDATRAGAVATTGGAPPGVVTPGQRDRQDDDRRHAEPEPSVGAAHPCSPRASCSPAANAVGEIPDTNGASAHIPGRPRTGRWTPGYAPALVPRPAARLIVAALLAAPLVAGPLFATGASAAESKLTVTAVSTKPRLRDRWRRAAARPPRRIDHPTLLRRRART